MLQDNLIVDKNGPSHMSQPQVMSYLYPIYIILNMLDNCTILFPIEAQLKVKRLIKSMKIKKVTRKNYGYSSKCSFIARSFFIRHN